MGLLLLLKFILWHNRYKIQLLRDVYIINEHGRTIRNKMLSFFTVFCNRINIFCKINWESYSNRLLQYNFSENATNQLVSRVLNAKHLEIGICF